MYCLALRRLFGLVWIRSARSAPVPLLDCVIVCGEEEAGTRGWVLNDCPTSVISTFNRILNLVKPWIMGSHIIFVHLTSSKFRLPYPNRYLVLPANANSLSTENLIFQWVAETNDTWFYLIYLHLQLNFQFGFWRVEYLVLPLFVAGLSYGQQFQIQLQIQFPASSFGPLSEMIRSLATSFLVAVGIVVFFWHYG